MTSIAEDLASHGYIILAVDHPHGGTTLFPDGSLSTTGDDSTRWNEPEFQALQMNEWGADVSFLLDRLSSGHLPSATMRVARGIDWTRVGAMGHSSGGLAALEACAHDKRMRACVNMDGGLTAPDGKPIADFAIEGAVRPTLMLRSRPIYSDADHAKRGRTREQWEAAGRKASAVVDSLPKAPGVPFYQVGIAGTGHSSFSDGAFVMPTNITRFGGKIIDAQRGFLIITETTRAFFDEYLGSSRSGSFLSSIAKYPEIEFKEIGRVRNAK